MNASTAAHRAIQTNGYEHIQEYDPRDKNVIPETSGSGLITATAATQDQAAQPSGSGFAVYFISGVGGVMLLIALSYGMILFGYKVGWLREPEEDESDDNEADEEPFWKRMTLEERRQVLDEALEAKFHESFRVVQKTKVMDVVCMDGTDGDTQKKNIDESSFDEDDDYFGVDVESVSSTSTSPSDDANGDAVDSSDSCDRRSRHKRCTSGRRGIDDDPEMDGTAHIHPQDNDTSESHVACSICLEEYQAEDEVVIGINCIHMFHKVCAIDWLEKQEVCPCCRETMISSERMSDAASTVLSAERMQELENGEQSNSQNSSDEFEAEQRIVIPAW
uniref:RING-type domain-containing protein n=1 Tax=Minutocellus polymorphus TaxID=265543 RepID=A0A7S0ACQ4_9STRA